MPLKEKIQNLIKIDDLTPFAFSDLPWYWLFEGNLKLTSLFKKIIR